MYVCMYVLMSINFSMLHDAMMELHRELDRVSSEPPNQTCV